MPQTSLEAYDTSLDPVISWKKNMLFIPIEIVNVLVVYICNYYSDI